MDTFMKTLEYFNVICDKEWAYKTQFKNAPTQHRGALDKRGFTLIELLMVIAIVAILAIVALPSYSKLKDLAKNARAETEIRMLEKQITLYVVDNNVLPPSGNLSVIPNAALIDPWGNQYVYNVITGPTDANAYGTISKGTDPLNSDYDLFSMGKNGATTSAILDGTSTDDIVRCGNIGKVVLGEKYDD